MSIKSTIIDPATGNEAKVHPEGYVRTIAAAFPPDAPPKLFPFIEKFSLNGDRTNNDMRVNGSVTPQKFELQARPENDLYITDLLLVIADAGMGDWSEFGNLAALTNGCSFKWISLTREATFNEAVKTNYDLATTFLFGGMDWYQAGMRGRMSNVIASAEGLSMKFDMVRLIPPWGLHLQRGTLDRLVFAINDNISSGLDLFEMTAYGFERIPDGVSNG